MKTYFIQYLNRSFVLKASLWLYIILTRRKLKRIYYFIIHFNKKAKECNIQNITDIGLSLLFEFSLYKWTLFYTKGLHHSFNTDFRI